MRKISDMQKKIGLILLLAILATGIYARFVELEWHFTNVDDRGVAETIFKNRQTNEYGRFPIPTFYTYAPLQFLITPWLISDDQEYRDTIFWGRLPSCLLGILGLFFFIFFYRLYEKEHISRMFLPLALLACSWENIIHAKQMHNYAFGVTACIGVLILIFYNLSLKKISVAQTLINALLFTVCSYAHYQILPLIPCAYLTLFLYFIKIDQKKWHLFLKFLISGLL